jgi:hypothetical protein
VVDRIFASDGDRRRRGWIFGSLDTAGNVSAFVNGACDLIEESFKEEEEIKRL